MVLQNRVLLVEVLSHQPIPTIVFLTNSALPSGWIVDRSWIGLQSVGCLHDLKVYISPGFRSVSPALCKTPFHVRVHKRIHTSKKLFNVIFVTDDIEILKMKKHMESHT